MRKFCLILLLLFSINLPSFAGFEVGDTNVLAYKMKVRNTPPYINTKSRVIASLPVNTTVEIIYTSLGSIGKWHKIKWYSAVDETFKEAWVEHDSLVLKVVIDKEDESFKESCLVAYNAVITLNDFDWDTHDYFLKYENYDAAIEMYDKKLYNFFLTLDIADYKNSIEKVDMAQRLREKIGGFLQLRGVSLIYKQQYVTALNDIDEAIFYSNSYVGYILKGGVLFEQGYYSKAKVAFVKAKALALKEGNEKVVMEINQFLSDINYQLAKLK